ncbi:uncharacterized protein V1510DRAFT_422111 [Dipodascopsis tothii]|uniref:uncharacterized protein n=1 Tax=Dipodascopsis tothii TaxID=44089 RepID=UPI0034CF7677
MSGNTPVPIPAPAAAQTVTRAPTGAPKPLPMVKTELPPVRAPGVMPRFSLPTASDSSDSDSDLEGMLARPTTVLSTTDHAASSAAAGDESIAATEELKAALMWRVREMRERIREMKDRAAQLEQMQKAEKPDNVADIIAQLLRSNDAVVDGELDTERRALDQVKEDSQLPYLPDSVFDKDKIAMFTDLSIDSVSGDTEMVPLSSTDGTNGRRMVRKRRHTIMCKHLPSEIEIHAVLVVNESDLEVMGLSVRADSISPLWARAPLIELSNKVGYNISALLYGVSELGRLSIIRARTFGRLSETFNGICALKPPPLSARSQNRLSAEVTDKGRPSKRLKRDLQLQRDTKLCMGEPKLTFVSPSLGLKLVISWTVALDEFSGDGNSAVNAFVSLPAYYDEISGSDSYRKVPKVFSDLVRQKGVYTAASILIRGLFQADLAS